MSSTADARKIIPAVRVSIAPPFEYVFDGIQGYGRWGGA